MLFVVFLEICDYNNDIEKEVGLDFSSWLDTAVILGRMTHHMKSFSRNILANMVVSGRLTNGISLAQLSNATGILPGQLSMIENLTVNIFCFNITTSPLT